MPLLAKSPGAAAPPLAEAALAGDHRWCCSRPLAKDAGAAQCARARGVAAPCARSRCPGGLLLALCRGARHLQAGGLRCAGGLGLSASLQAGKRCRSPGARTRALNRAPTHCRPEAVPEDPDHAGEKRCRGRWPAHAAGRRARPRHASLAAVQHPLASFWHCHTRLVTRRGCWGRRRPPAPC